MNIKKNFEMLIGVLLALSMSSPVWSGDYSGDWLEVRVVDKQSGSPVGQAAVCLGTSARPDQFGARRAGVDGTVRFDELPANSMVLTASQRGYQGRQHGVGSWSGNRVIVLNLAPGGGGPVCKAAPGDTRPESAGELEITNARLSPDTNSSSDGRVFVVVRVSGYANQIRIAESASFTGAVWQELQPQNPYTVSEGNGVKRLYVQVRRQVETKGASLEVLSPVKVVPYRRF